MRTPIAILVGTVLLVGAVATAAGAEPAHLPHGPLTRAEFTAAKTVPPGAKNGELGDAAITSDRYDMLRNALDLRIDPATESISGSVQMVFASEVAGLDAFVFDLIANLQVDGVDHAGGPLVFTHAADSVVVTLPAALGPGEIDSLVVRYSGVPTSPIVNRGLMFKTHFPLPPIPQDQLVPIVANLSQPAYAQSWWPCKDRPDDKFLVSMDLTVPDTLIGVSNGTLTGETAAEPGWRTYQWRSAYPIATYLVSVAISDYVRLFESCTTTLGTVVPLENWVFPRDVDNALVDFAPLCSMMDFCESRYGAYPFAGEKYGHAVFLWPGAMEHQTVTSIGSTSLDGTGDREWLIMHELAHQWFGDSMTPADWADIWLNEGFATYAEALWFEHTGGAGDYATYMANARRESEWIAQGPVHDPMPVFPGRVIYDKGAWILHMLRGRMGDGPFFDLLTAWTAEGGRPLGYVDTQEFIDLAGTWAGEDLNGFLWPYLETTVLPVVAFAYDVEDGLAGPGTRLRVDLSQQQTPLFDNTYPIVVTTSAGPVTVRANLAAVAAEFVFELDDPIQSAVLDPTATLLWHAAGTTTPSAGLTFVFPNPSRGNYVVLRYRLAAPSRLQLRIFDALGREVAARDLGQEPAGTHDYGFDIAGDDGRRLPSGVYWAALYANGDRSVARFTVVR